MYQRKTADIYKQNLKKGGKSVQGKALNYSEIQRSDTEQKALAKLHERLTFITNNYYVKNFKVESSLCKQNTKQLKTSFTQLRQPRGQSATIEAKRSEKKIHRQYESLQPKKTYTESSSNIEKLLKKQQNNKIPSSLKKNIWHSFLNQSAIPNRKVKSQLHIKEDHITNSEAKNRSAHSLHSQLTTTEFVQFNLSYGIRTKQGVLATNPNKVNQDSYICEANLVQDLHLFSVCDGHGQNGHFVSQFVRDKLPQYLKLDPHISSNNREAITKAVSILSAQVNKCSFDTQFSGTTLNSIMIVDGGKLLCFNLGDSRAIIGKSIGNGKFKPFPLSIDHKPSLVREQTRIKQCGGRIDTYYDQEGNPIGPARVWVSNGNYPGLAMSRSLGDQVAQSVGVSSVPEIFEYQLNPHDKFIILGTDGVWEFLDNQTVVDLVGKYYQKQNIEGACDELLRVAYKMWTIEDDSVVDDITFIIIFIQQSQ